MPPTDWIQSRITPSGSPGPTLSPTTSCLWESPPTAWSTLPMWSRLSPRSSLRILNGTNRHQTRLDRTRRRPPLEVLEDRQLLSGSSLLQNAGPNQTANVGTMVTFQGTASGSGKLSYSWTFGDGGTASGTLSPS